MGTSFPENHLRNHLRNGLALKDLPRGPAWQIDGKIVEALGLLTSQFAYAPAPDRGTPRGRRCKG
jgi:hypothetical protein